MPNSSIRQSGLFFCDIWISWSGCIPEKIVRCRSWDNWVWDVLSDSRYPKRECAIIKVATVECQESTFLLQGMRRFTFSKHSMLSLSITLYNFGINAHPCLSTCSLVPRLGRWLRNEAVCYRTDETSGLERMRRYDLQELW